MKKNIIIIILLVAAFIIPLNAQNKNNVDFESLYKRKRYKQSLNIIRKKLKDIYEKSLDKKLITKVYIMSGLKPQNESMDKYITQKRLFQNKRVESFFIKENKELFNLHLFAGRCQFQLKKSLYALNHYIQSLRYKHLEKKDHVILYEIAQVFKDGDNYRSKVSYKAYLRALETAYTLNPDESKYSLELGRELYYSRKKKQAIYHLRRFIELNDKPPLYIYVMLGNLFEQTNRYLDTQKYYKEYLVKSSNSLAKDNVWPSGKKIEKGYIQYALGYIAYAKTGNHSLAIRSLKSAIKELPKKEIHKHSKSHEYLGDIALSDLNFSDAISLYLATIEYQKKIFKQIERNKVELNKVNNQIKILKASLLNKQDNDKFLIYQNKERQRGKLKQKHEILFNEYKKLNPGKVRWNIAYALKKLERYKAAIKYYNECIKLGYKFKKAVIEIKKLELKIKRGY